MKSIRNIVSAGSCIVIAALGHAQATNGGLSVTTKVTTNSTVHLAAGTPSSPMARPQVTFPPTPHAQATLATMTQEQLDDHILPRNILSQTSDVIGISYNGFRRSQLDPCGCVSHQLGGLDKEAGVIKRLQELKIPIVIADAGGYVRDNPTDTDIARSKLLLKALHSLGENVANVGYSDLSGGVDRLKATAEAASVELISANVTDSSGKLIFKPYSIQSVKTPSGEVKVGFVGVTRPRIPVTKKKATSDTQDMSTPAAEGESSAGYTVTDAADALAKVVPEVRGKADLVVALIYDRRDKVGEMLKDIPDTGKVDIAVSGEYLQPQANVLDINGTKLVSGGYEGRQTGLLVVSVKDKKITAASNQFIEILQSIPTVPEITKYVTEAKGLTMAPAANPVIHTSVAPTQLNLGKEETTTHTAKGSTTSKSTSVKLDLGKE